MYKIMVISDLKSVKQIFSKISDWNHLGFKEPHYRDSFDSMIEGLEKHHIDSIGIDLKSRKDQVKALNYLDEFYPNVPIFSITKTVDDQRKSLKKLIKVLDETHADSFDDLYSEEQMLENARLRWIHDFLSGKTSNDVCLNEVCKLLRIHTNPANPCILIDFELPQGSDYLSGSWHYGSKRLEVALRNFFGPGLSCADINIAVLNYTTGRLLISPIGETECKDLLNNNTINEKLITYLEDVTQNIFEFMGLSLNIIHIQKYTNMDEVLKTVNM